MPSQTFLALCVAGLFQTHLLVAAPVAETPVAIPASVTVEEIPALLRTVDDALKIRKDALLSVLELEAAAKRVPVSVGERLRASFQAEIFTSSDADSALADAEIPKGNEKVARAEDAFLEACDVAEAQRSETAAHAMAAIAQRTTDLTRNARSMEDFSGCIANVQLLAHELGVQTVHHKQGYSCGADLSACSSYLVVLDVLLANAVRNDFAASYLDKAQFWANEARSFVAPEDVRRRLVPFLDPFRTEATIARERLESALFDKSPAKVASDALKKFSDVQRNFEQLSSPFSQSRVRAMGINFRAYDSLVSVLKAIEAGDALEARRSAGQARVNIWERGIENGAKMLELAVSWERENPDLRKIEARDLRALLSTKLAQAKSAADLEALASEVAAKLKTAPGYHYSLIADPLQHAIENAAKSWSAGGPLPEAVKEDASRFVSEWAEFQSRILREDAATTLSSPELKVVPFSQKPLFEALDDFCESLASRKDWRRLVRVLESMRGHGWAIDGSPRREETLGSLKLYLQGRNFESAELWTDAALAYKGVLITSGRWVPMEDTALRLKTLASEHPAEVRAAQFPPLEEPNRIR